MHSEGPNVRLSRIRQGGSNFEFASLALNTDKGIIGVKSDDADTWRTAVYENRTLLRQQYRCERRPPSVFAGGAVYSITAMCFIFKRQHLNLGVSQILLGLFS